MSHWIEKSKTSSILNVAQGISVGAQLVGKHWSINVVGTKIETGSADLDVAKVMAERLLGERLQEATANLGEMMVYGYSPPG